MKSNRWSASFVKKIGIALLGVAVLLILPTVVTFRSSAAGPNPVNASEFAQAMSGPLLLGVVAATVGWAGLVLLILGFAWSWNSQRRDARHA